MSNAGKNFKRSFEKVELIFFRQLYMVWIAILGILILKLPFPYEIKILLCQILISLLIQVHQAIHLIEAYVSRE